MRESKIEAKFRELCQAAGDLCFKFVSPGRVGVPDRLRLCPIPPEHRAIVARYIQFVELKATGKVPSSAQLREHDRIRALGFVVHVTDSLEGVRAIVQGEAL